MKVIKFIWDVIVNIVIDNVVSVILAGILWAVLGAFNVPNSLEISLNVLSYLPWILFGWYFVGDMFDGKKKKF